MNKIKLSIIFVLLIVIIFLMIYLMCFINKYEQKNEDPYKDCTFNTPYYLLSTFDYKILCSGYNKLYLDNVRLDGLKQNMYIIYYKGTLNTLDDKSGIYLNNKKIIKGASNNYKNIINVYDNMLFIRLDNINDYNLLVYNSSGNKLYDFKHMLETNYIKDPAFSDSLLTTDNIDKETFKVDFKTISFNSKSKCEIGQLYEGSRFEIQYHGSNFAKPTFVSFVKC